MSSGSPESRDLRGSRDLPDLRGFQERSSLRGPALPGGRPAHSGGDVDSPAGVFAKRGRLFDGEALGAIAAGKTSAARQDKRADLFRAVVGVEVAAVEVAEAWVADDVAADDRAAKGGAAARIFVRVVEDRFGEAARGRARRRWIRVGDEALAAVPAVVGAGAADDSGRRARGDVDLLAGVLPDVGDHHVARRPIEGEAPGIAQPVGPDLVAACRRGEGIAGRDRVGRDLARMRVDAEDLAQQLFGVLAVFEGIAAAAAVAERDVEVAVGAELELAAVVVGFLGVADAEDRFADRRAAAGIRAKGVEVDVAFGPAGLGRAGVGRVDAAAAFEVGGWRDREHAPLDFAAADQFGQVEELARVGGGAFDDLAFALDDQQPFRVGRARGDVDGLVEFADRLQRRRLGRRAAKGESSCNDE